MLFLLILYLLILQVTLPFLYIILDGFLHYIRKKSLAFELTIFGLGAFQALIVYEILIKRGQQVTAKFWGYTHLLQSHTHWFDQEHMLTFLMFVLLSFTSYFLLKFFRKYKKDGETMEQEMSKKWQITFLGGVYLAIVVTLIYTIYVISIMDFEDFLLHLQMNSKSLADFLLLPDTIIRLDNFYMVIFSILFLVHNIGLLIELKKDNVPLKTFVSGIGMAVVLVAAVILIGMIFGQEPDSFIKFFRQSNEIL